MPNTDNPIKTEMDRLREARTNCSAADAACAGRVVATADTLAGGRPRNPALRGIDLGMTYENLKGFERLGVSIIPSKSNPFGQGAVQLDLFK